MDLVTLMQVCSFSNNEIERREFCKEHEIDVREHELLTINRLLYCLKNDCSLSNDLLSLKSDDFWIGFKIPQIGEEFDLLRFGNNYNLNIELKSDNDEEKMTKQLKRKKHYLKFLLIPTYHFVFSSESDTLYTLDTNEELKQVSFTDLWSYIYHQDIDKKNLLEIQRLFNPSNYLISPFNTTDKFINTEYFLTNHQEKIKNEIIKKIGDGELLYMIEGTSGTGKTLLVYDLIKTYMDKNKTVLTVHTGKINNGHMILNTKYNWNIYPIKSVFTKLNKDLDLVVIDESQRLDKKVDEIISFCEENKIPCVFSLDRNQCLHKKEINRNIREKLSKKIRKENSYKLKEKIRSNKELADFIKLFNKIPINSITRLDNADNNIKIKYFKTKEEALAYVSYLKMDDWKHLTYSNSLHTVERLDNLVVAGEENPHNVIGQEFEKVVVMIDDNFGYLMNEQGTSFNLSGRTQAYYHTVKMLFQNVTRARKELCLVIFNNPDFFMKVSGILKKI
ncbi:DNA/RNA helicase domain-containing protein [Vagococcus fluvialis]|uniref:DNA/RNA helicase domain-containing protein n=1 Tax=Vagococcus fluvialis TaxID=2738 RepID=UPI001A8D85DA|nr:DNA/RNA helicase domain-containing protein [Vagococcus fluvialis]MBO0487176.1 DUF2075 domain-containing protein [Vagococcus fluvialis]